MVALGTAALSGFYPAYLNLENTYSLTYDRLHLADFRISTVLSTEMFSIANVTDIISTLQETYPIDSFECRIVSEMTALENNSGQLNLIGVRVIGINVTGGRHPTVNDIQLMEGRWFADDNWNASRPDNEYVGIVDARLASYHGLTPGSHLNLLASGNVNDSTDVHILGDAGTAEYLWIAASWQDLMPSPRRFGLLYVPLSSMQHLLGESQDAANDICVTMRPGTTRDVRDRTMEALRAVLVDRGYNVMPPTPREDEPSYAGLKLDLDGIAEMVSIFPTFILLFAALGTYITMSRLVNAQRQEVGVALALGYGSGDVMRKYLAYGLVIGVVGGMAGVVVGEAIGHWFTDTYLSMMVVPFRYYGFYPEIDLASMILGIAAVVVGSLVPARRCVRMTPTEAMRDDPAAVTMGRKPLVERMMKRLTGSEPRTRNKIVLRNLFRNRRRTISTIGGIMIGLVLVASTAGVNDSFAITLEAMRVREGWDLQVQYTDFKDPFAIDHDLEVIESWPEVKTAYAGITFSTVLTVNQSDSRVILQLRVQDPEDSVHQFQFLSPDGAFNDSGIVITRGTAKRLGIGKGDYINVLHPRFNVTSFYPLRYTFTMANSSVLVTGVTVESTTLVCWMSYAVARGLVGQAQIGANTIYIKARSPEDTSVVRQRVFRHIAGVRSAISPAEAADDMSRYMDELRLFLDILIGLSLALSGSVVLTTAVINVLERRREVATAMMMGASPSLIERLFLVENLVVTTVGLALGVPLSHAALNELANAFNNDFFEFLVGIYAQTMILSVLAVFVASIVVQWIVVRGFRHMDLVQETKRRIE